jgi:hypothetical protein
MMLPGDKTYRMGWKDAKGVDRMSMLPQYLSLSLYLHLPPPSTRRQRSLTPP